MRRPRPLSATFVRQIRAPGFYGDGRGGHGLSLLVKEMASSGRISKCFVQRIRIDGRAHNLGLGAFPLVSLAEARATALENAQLARKGKHPREHAIPTFSQAAEKVIEGRRATWTHARGEEEWRRSFAIAIPILGSKRVDRITTADVLKCLVPIWQSKHATAKRLRGRLADVFDWAESHGHRSGSNPAGKAIAAALPAPARGTEHQHHRAIHYSEVADAIARVHASGAWIGTKRCFEWMVLTAARSGEARGAAWAEVDLEAKTWTVPAERMKARREHRVPLAHRAVEILREAHADTGGEGLVFPSRAGTVLCVTVHAKLLRQLGVPAVPHGFRSSFRDSASERTGLPEAVAEAALAHAPGGGDATVAAYARSTLLKKRRELMERWARYLEEGPAQVVTLNARRA